jgi:hypothetical protein
MKKTKENTQKEDYLKEDYLKEDYLKEDYLKEDYLKEDYLKEDYLKEDYLKEDYLKEDDLKEDVLNDNEFIIGNQNENMLGINRDFKIKKIYQDNYVFLVRKYDTNGSGNLLFEGLKMVGKNQFLRFGTELEKNTFYKNLKMNFKGGVFLIHIPK